MKRGVLLLGSALGTGGAGLLAAGYGAAGVLLFVLALACVVVALTVTWRLDEAEEALRATDGLPPA